MRRCVLKTSCSKTFLIIQHTLVMCSIVYSIVLRQYKSLLSLSFSVVQNVCVCVLHRVCTDYITEKDRTHTFFAQSYTLHTHTLNVCREQQTSQQTIVEKDFHNLHYYVVKSTLLQLDYSLVSKNRVQNFNNVKDQPVLHSLSLSMIYTHQCTCITHTERETPPSFLPYKTHLEQNFINFFLFSTQISTKCRFPIGEYGGVVGEPNRQLKKS